MLNLLLLIPFYYCLIPGHSSLATQADFNGTWIYDAIASELPNFAGNLVIAQYGNIITIFPTSSPDTRGICYISDGGDHIVTQSDSLRSYRAVLSGNTLRIIVTRRLGTSISKSEKLLSLSPDGNTLTETVFLSTPKGSQLRKIVYRKK